MVSSNVQNNYANKVISVLLTLSMEKRSLIFSMSLVSWNVMMFLDCTPLTPNGTTVGIAIFRAEKAMHNDI